MSQSYGDSPDLGGFFLSRHLLLPTPVPILHTCCLVTLISGHLVTLILEPFLFPAGI